MKKLLIVEDQTDLVKLLGVVLRGDGRTLLAAENGVEALALARQEVPDVILLDVMLPGELNGYEVARAIKGDSRTERCGVIIMTAKVQEEDRRDAYAAGADDFLGKPFRMEVLKEKVARFVGDR